jgi:hypothetical protein
VIFLERLVFNINPKPVDVLTRPHNHHHLTMRVDVKLSLTIPRETIDLNLNMSKPDLETTINPSEP